MHGDEAGTALSTLPNEDREEAADFEEYAGNIHLGGTRLPMIPVSRRDVKPPLVDLSELLGEPFQEAQPFAFCEAGWFQSITALVILFNAIIIGFETDIESPNWVYVEHFTLAFFVLEISVRMLHYKCQFFFAAANLFDLVIVVSGVGDMWLMRFIELILWGGSNSHRSNAVTQVIQMLRLIRIVRLVRLIKLVEQLHRLSLAIASAVQGVVWVLIFMAMVVYAVAIVLTRTIGRDPVSDVSYDPAEAKAEEVHEMFHSVLSSMFVLFEMMSFWSLMQFSPLFHRIPILRLLAVVFYILSAWALLAVMTGVVSDKMIAVKQALMSEECSESQAMARSQANILEEAFRTIDKDHSGTISADEFNALLLSTDILAKLMKYGSISVADLEDLFDYLDRNKNRLVDREEFIETFMLLHDEITPRSLLKMQEEIMSDLRQLEQYLTDFIRNGVDKLLEVVRTPFSKLHQVTAQIQRFDVIVQARKGVCPMPSAGPITVTVPPAKGRVPSCTRADLAELEQRLGARIDRLDEAVAVLERLSVKGRLRLARPDEPFPEGLKTPTTPRTPTPREAEDEEVRLPAGAVPARASRLSTALGKGMPY